MNLTINSFHIKKLLTRLFFEICLNRFCCFLFGNFSFLFNYRHVKCWRRKKKEKSLRKNKTGLDQFQATGCSVTPHEINAMKLFQIVVFSELWSYSSSTDFFQYKAYVLVVLESGVGEPVL